MRQVLAVIRFSAMGDVAILAAVLMDFQQQYKNEKLLVITKKKNSGVLALLKNTEVACLEDYGGNLYKLYKDVTTRYTITQVADMHDNLRSRMLGLLFKLEGIKLRIIDKGRKEKRRLVRHGAAGPDKYLKKTTQRYADVLYRLGYAFILNENTQARAAQCADMGKRGRQMLLEMAQNTTLVGIAPYAQHDAKALPAERLQVLVRLLNDKGITPYVFGGGKTEQEATEKNLAGLGYSSMIGKTNLYTELDCMAALDVMISADSANMHMAAMVGTRVISLWGPTHPAAGFTAYGQSDDDAVQVQDERRPNSIYGNKPLIKNGRPIMHYLNMQQVIDKLNEIL